MGLTQLRNLGSNWRRSFPELRFLGQVALDRQVCEEYWTTLGRCFLSRSRDAFERMERGDLDAAVAVVVSNLAFFFDPRDAVLENALQHGFISFVTSPLGWVGHERGGNAQALWQERIGRPVRRLLEAELSYVEPERDAGAWRFVRPILRQGGVPLKLIDRFLTWFEPLAARFDLTELDYHRHLRRSQEPGTMLKWFLYGPEGYEFCAAVLRGLRSPHDVSQNGVRSELLERARDRFATRVRAQRQLPSARPSFALDVSTLTLGIRIPEEAKTEYRHEAVRIYSFLPLRTTTPCIRIECRRGPLAETVEIQVPLPLGNGGWLAFTDGTGRLVAASPRSSMVPRGRFVIVGGEEVQSVLEGVKVETLGELESLGNDRRLVATVCEFRSACEISLPTGGVVPMSDRVPAAIEIEGVPAVQGTTVYIGQGPTVRVALPAELPFQAWFTSASSSSELAEPKPAPVSAEGVISYETSPGAASKVTVWVEPGGLAPRSWLPELMETEFVVFPVGTTLAWPVLPLSYDEAPSLAADGDAISDIRANGRPMVRGADGRFVLPKDEVVVLVITTSRGLSVQIARRIRRVKLHAPELDGFDACPALFLSDVENSTPLVIDVPEYTAGAAVELGVLSHGELTDATTIVVPPAVRRGHPFRFPSRTLRDPLGRADVGVLALRMDGRVVRTGTLYARDPLDLLLPELQPVEDLGRLEDSWGGAIRQFHELRDHPADIQVPVATSREMLHILMVRISTMAAILDHGDTDAEAAECPDLNSLRLAVRAARTGGPVGTELLDALLDLTRDPVVTRVIRWRDQLISMTATLREQSDFRLLVQRWRDCWNGRVLNEAAVAETVLYRMDGGPLLTEGARKLFIALRAHQKISFLSGPDGALECLKVAATGNSAIVSTLANAFRIGAYLFMGDVASARRTLGDIAGSPMPAWCPLIEDLDAAVTGQLPVRREVAAESVRVWDIQPEGITLFDTQGGDEE